MVSSDSVIRKRVQFRPANALRIAAPVLCLVLLFLCGSAFAAEVSPGDNRNSLPRPPAMIGEDALMYRKAMMLFSRKDWNGAIGEINGLLKTHPDSVLTGPSYLLLGRISARRAARPGLNRQERNEFYQNAIRLYWRAHYAHPPQWDRGRVAYRMGRLMFKRGFYPEAKGYLEMGLGESPDGPRSFDSHLLMAEIFRREHHLNASRQILDRLSGRLSPQMQNPLEERISLDYEKARVALSLGRVPEAGSLLGQALLLDGSYPYKHPSLLFLLGRYADRAGHNHRAFALYRSFLKFDPESSHVPEAHYRMALLSGRLGRKRSMEARLMDLAKEFPESDWAIRSRLKLTESLNRRYSGKNSAESPHRKSELDKTIDRLRKVDLKRGSPQSRVMALSLMVPLLAERNQWSQALRKLHQVSSLVEPHSSLGRRVAGLETGLVYGWILSEKNPPHPRKVLYLARSYGYALTPALTDPHPTVFEEEAIRESPRVFVRIGKAEELLKRPKEAGVWYRKALSVASLKERPEILGNLFRLAIARKDPTEAYQTGLILLAVLLKDDPEKPVWMGRLANLARELGKGDRERSLLEDRLRLYPEDESSGRSLARLFEIRESRGEYQASLETAIRARSFLEDSRDPRDRKSLLTLLYGWGRMESELHHPDRSYRIWTEFVRIAPKDPRSGWVRYQLGNMAEAMGHPDEAYAWFVQASKDNSSIPLADVARQRARGIKLAREVDGHGP
ncbi:MAG: tetratricopeptide repeat protein [Leptospirales bacterium]